MTARAMLLIAAAALLLTGCHPSNPPAATTSPQSPNDIAEAANKAFLSQKTFDPWVLKNSDPKTPIAAYYASKGVGHLFAPDGREVAQYLAGIYKNGLIATAPGSYPPVGGFNSSAPSGQVLDLHAGTLATTRAGSTDTNAFANQVEPWPRLWQTSDVVIDGDPEAQQVTHANLFYLLSSTYPGSDHSIPPMGLSSGVYGGHIFWDADVWMLPALLPQHPEYAKPIVDYRFKLLAQARRNAKAHGFAGAEYPWESADTGQEVAPTEFAKERHITADVGWAAWQYYLWTGDKAYLQKEGWPLLQATAQYWVSRVTRGPDDRYHIKGVLSPDETAGVVDDDAYTNAVVQANLRAATRAAGLVGQTADPRWAAIAGALYFPQDKTDGIPAEHEGMDTGHRFQAKQADTLLLIHPLGVRFDSSTEGKMLDFYTAHTSKFGPAMTTSIHAIVAAQLGRAQPSLDLFHDSYRPFERAPWDAFSEKRTTNNVYFLTGMAGCVQTVLYGFAGLHVYTAGEKPTGARLAGDAEAALYADPHLPPGWTRLAIMGIRFRGNTLNLAITPGNKATVTSAVLAGKGTGVRRTTGP